MHRANAGGESERDSERESEREGDAYTGPTLAVFRDNAILAEFVRITQ
jgi:hypothetical protein